MAFTVCPSKLMFHIPCPGCGVTRATLMFFEGKFWDAILFNPNCLLAVSYIFLYPLAAFYALLFKHSFIVDCYNYFTKQMEKKVFLGIVLFVEGTIWVYNIVRGI